MAHSTKQEYAEAHMIGMHMQAQCIRLCVTLIERGRIAEAIEALTETADEMQHAHGTYFTLKD